MRKITLITLAAFLLAALGWWAFPRTAHAIPTHPDASAYPLVSHHGSNGYAPDGTCPQPPQRGVALSGLTPAQRAYFGLPERPTLANTQGMTTASLATAQATWDAHMSARSTWYRHRYCAYTPAHAPTHSSQPGIVYSAQANVAGVNTNSNNLVQAVEDSAWPISCAQQSLAAPMMASWLQARIGGFTQPYMIVAGIVLEQLNVYNNTYAYFGAIQGPNDPNPIGGFAVNCATDSVAYTVTYDPYGQAVAAMNASSSNGGYMHYTNTDLGRNYGIGYTDFTGLGGYMNMVPVKFGNQTWNSQLWGIDANSHKTVPITLANTTCYATDWWQGHTLVGIVAPYPLAEGNGSFDTEVQWFAST